MPFLIVKFLAIICGLSEGVQGFIWPKLLGGGNMGKVEVMGRLGGPSGWVQEGDVPPFYAGS